LPKQKKPKINQPDIFENNTQQEPSNGSNENQTEQSVPHEQRVEQPATLEEPDYAGKAFTITGKLEHISRRKVKELVENIGGIFKERITSEVKYLVVGNLSSESIKTKKAKDLGISVLSEDEFLAIVHNKP